MSSEERNSLRTAIFTQAKESHKKEEVDFFGQKVELRQPTLESILEAKDMDNKSALVEQMIKYCYVPGTDERVFEEGDRPDLMAMPFGPDVLRFNDALTAMTGVDIAGAEKNSEDIPSES